jgi:hypothetical protein
MSQLPNHIRAWKKPSKKSERSKLIEKLDGVFSEFIRLRDSDKNGICKCITSGEFKHWTEVDAGHFITRDNMATRWDEQNVNAQGRGDNRFKSGKQYEHGLAIDKKHGPGTASKLLVKSKGVCNWEEFELKKMFEYYRDQVKILKSEKGMI